MPDTGHYLWRENGEIVFVRAVVPVEGEFIIESAAVMSCWTCGTMISGMGGGPRALCTHCGQVVIEFEEWIRNLDG